MRSASILFLSLLASFHSNAQQKIVFANEKDSASYAAGLNEGERMMMMLEQSGADTILNQPLFFTGFADYIAKNPQMDLDAAKDVLQSYFSKFQALLEEKQREQDEAFKKLHFANKEKSNLFLVENQKKEGVLTTSSGLQYQVIKKGKGKNIQMGDVIKVGYIGTLTDGTLIDSISKNTPYEMELTEGSLIPGWTEALLLMKKGSQYKIFIPYDLGYGDMGKEPDIPPYAVLVFDLEVIDHIPKK
jgi:FKBP-type peptidyl-prolyl cis-trans isomerase FklB